MKRTIIALAAAAAAGAAFAQANHIEIIGPGSQHVEIIGVNAQAHPLAQPAQVVSNLPAAAPAPAPAVAPQRSAQVASAAVPQRPAAPAIATPAPAPAPAVAVPLGVTAPAAPPAVTARPPVQQPTLQPITNTPQITAQPRERAQGRVLSSNERAMLEASRRWEATGQAEALIGQSGAIMVPYGHARPTITCAPLHICTIRLIEGERITSLALGDTVRWLVQESRAGDTPVIVAKPTQAGISTNLVVTTEAGRVYYMHLVASRKEYTPMVNFFDPAAIVRRVSNEAQELARMQARLEAAEAAARQAREAQQAAAQAHRERTVVADRSDGGNLDPATMQFGWTCSGEASVKPVQVFNNPTHTFVQMHERVMQSGQLPALFAYHAGNTELVNQRVRGNFFVVDGRPANITLRLGVGSDAPRIATCRAPGTPAAPEQPRSGK